MLDKVVSGIWKQLSKEEKEGYQILSSCKQEFLIDKWDPNPEKNLNDKKSFLKKIFELNSEYPGGLHNF